LADIHSELKTIARVEGPMDLAVLCIIYESYYFNSILFGCKL